MAVPFFPKASRCLLLLAGFLLLCSGFLSVARAQRNGGRKYTPPPVTAVIKVTVLRDTNGKPIANAAVVFHPMEGDKDKAPSS